MSGTGAILLVVILPCVILGLSNTGKPLDVPGMTLGAQALGGRVVMTFISAAGPGSPPDACILQMFTSDGKPFLQVRRNGPILVKGKEVANEPEACEEMWQALIKAQALPKEAGKRK